MKRAEKILKRINELSEITEEPGVITRTYGTPAFVEGRLLIVQWMEEAGLQTSIDHIGNVRGKIISEDSDEKTFVIGSHIDTVVDAGKFDGPLGVIMGIDLAEHIISSKLKLPFDLEIVAFCDEEGVRFQTTFLGSKALAGSFETVILNETDKDDVTLRQAIQGIGGDPQKINAKSIDAKNWLGYFEIHIEQGPVLYEKNIPVGLVTAIAGQCRVEIVLEGFAGHAGTVPMQMRKDALACAAEFILAVEEFAEEHKDKLVATVGKLDVPHSASNVIPGKAICTLDVRSADENFLESALQSIKKVTIDICSKRKIDLQWNNILQTKPVPCDQQLNHLLQQSITAAGYDAIELVSGAGHDAIAISDVSPVSMMFVRCFKGISHNPLENVETKDIAAAIAVADNFLNLFISNYNKSKWKYQH
ncbi:MAG: amidase, hydantoinase/carbamoylase family [Bacteroidota bacterium]|nr:amidase, hydantoinase/carbamoylase family [Bacteroidota bacterium]